MESTQLLSHLMNEDSPILYYVAERQRIFILLPLMALFATIGFGLARDGNPMGWLLVFIFGLAGVALSLQLLPGCNYLALDREGLTICSQFIPRKYPWETIEEFGIIQLGTIELVGMRFHKEYRLNNKQRASWFQPSHKYDISFSQFYGMTAEELTELLRQCHAARNGATRESGVIGT